MQWNDWLRYWEYTEDWKYLCARSQRRKYGEARIKPSGPDANQQAREIAEAKKNAKLDAKEVPHRDPVPPDYQYENLDCPKLFDQYADELFQGWFDEQCTLRVDEPSENPLHLVFEWYSFNLRRDEIEVNDAVAWSSFGSGFGGMSYYIPFPANRAIPIKPPPGFDVANTSGPSTFRTFEQQNPVAGPSKAKGKEKEITNLVPHSPAFEYRYPVLGAGRAKGKEKETTNNIPPYAFGHQNPIMGTADAKGKERETTNVAPHFPHVKHPNPVWGPDNKNGKVMQNVGVVSTHKAPHRGECLGSACLGGVPEPKMSDSWNYVRLDNPYMSLAPRAPTNNRPPKPRHPAHTVERPAIQAPRAVHPLKQAAHWLDIEDEVQEKILFAPRNERRAREEARRRTTRPTMNDAAPKRM